MREARGFTLIEVMVVVAMVAVLAAIATPSWQEFVANRRLAGAARQVFNGFQHARMKAVKEGVTTTVTYVDGQEGKVVGAGDDSKSFEKAILSWSDKDGVHNEVLFKAKNSVCFRTNHGSSNYNCRGLLFGAQHGTVRVWSTVTNREYKIIRNILGTLSQKSGVRTLSDPDAEARPETEP